MNRSGPQGSESGKWDAVNPSKGHKIIEQKVGGEGDGGVAEDLVGHSECLWPGCRAFSRTLASPFLNDQQWYSGLEVKHSTSCIQF